MRCVVLLLRIHQKPIVATRALQEQVRRAHALVGPVMSAYRARVGTNVAALKMLQQFDSDRVTVRI